ncbi:G-type lectin S-receptor-like serine/threonine-protein kinase SD2-5 [Acorus calamus]|uniref:G-type lectin S-receptor-like serine/threonine-protein kinase SD2-5 n=1 Tax=Acorus calamus TaxID=4465 RepID=A0AAV9CCH2_ACOCL|nr:G-type lectin S-receptor-like serine/threonine-protein kinase SD2-5 [Acorus calamus]
MDQQQVSHPFGELCRRIHGEIHPPPWQQWPRFACGFYCNGGGCDTYLFAIFIVQTNSGSGITLTGLPQVVWSANRNHPIKENATLELTRDGDLVLKDVDKTVVWSSNTSGKSVVGLNLTEAGNLVLFSRNNGMVWQSFDHPTDSLVPGQMLTEGQRLTANVSASNWTQGPLYLTIRSGKLYGYVESNPPQMYDSQEEQKHNTVTLANGTLTLELPLPQPTNQNFVEPTMQYMRLESDGHLKVYQWGESQGLLEWRVVDEFLKFYVGDCGFPTVCGEYGICSNKQCSCPSGTDGRSDNFRLLDPRQPNLGCSVVTLLSCQSPEQHHLLPVEDVSYFNYVDTGAAALNDTDAETCRTACLKNCSCKAALIQYSVNTSHVDCYLPTQLFSLFNIQPDYVHYNSSAFIKIQIEPTPPSPASNSNKKVKASTILGSVFGALFGSILIIGIGFLILRKGKVEEDAENAYKVSFETLKAATNDFCRKLGEGGFGSVFEGTLLDGTLVAVKRLDRIKAEDNNLYDIVDKENEDVQQNGDEAMKMLKVAIWCLQSDCNKRPSMSNVVKVLEGAAEIEPNVDYQFSTMMPAAVREDTHFSETSPILASILSGGLFVFVNKIELNNYVCLQREVENERKPPIDVTYDFSIIEWDIRLAGATCIHVGEDTLSIV